MSQYQDDYGQTRTRTTTDTDSQVDDLLGAQPDAQQIIIRGQVDYSSFSSLAHPDRERDLARLERRARTTGARLGARAYYSWRQAGQQIEGASVQAAYALLADYGFAACRVAVVERQGSKVQLRAAAIDLINFVFVERDALFTIRPAPGKYAAKPEEVERWEAMQTQSAASKAVRGAILRLVPDWAVQACVESAKQAASGDVLKPGQTVSQAAAEAVRNYSARHHVSLEQLEAYLGLPIAIWTVRELADLIAVWRSLAQGEATVGAVFPSEEQPRSPAPQPQPPQERPEPPARATEPTKAQDAPTASQEPQPDRGAIKRNIEREEGKLLDIGIDLSGPRQAAGIPEDFAVASSKHAAPALSAYLDALRTAYRSATAGPDEDLP